MAFPKSRILTSLKLIQMFQESEKKDKRFCFILGSGASVESEIPSGNILEMDWMRCLLGLKDDRGTPAMDADTSRELAQYLLEEGEIKHTFEEMEAAFHKAEAEKKNALSSEYYFDLYKLRFHPDLQDGYRYLESLMERKEPSPGYRALALLLTKTNRHNLVITTNFDNLTEDALFLHTDYRPLVVSHEALAEYIQFNTRRPIIVKVHRGLMYDPFNSPKTTDHLEKEWHKALEYAFQTYTPVVVGYGGGDQSLMAFLRDTTFPNGIYWCYREASGEPGEDIKTFLEEKKGYLVKTIGFDALMYTLGCNLYDEEVKLSKTQEYLEGQCDKRTDTYFARVKKVEKEIEEQAGKKSCTTVQKTVDEKPPVEESLTFWDYFNRAYEAAEKGDHDTAIKEYTLAIVKDPTRPIPYNNRGSSYHNLGQYERAIQDYDKAIELDPKDAETYNNRGISYYDLGQHERAIQDYDKAIELDSKDAKTYNNRGSCFDDLGQYERAIQDYNKAIELDPNDAAAYYNRGISYHNLGQHKRAIEDYNKAIELDPNSADAYNSRGISYHDLGQHEHAIQDYTKAIELDPNDASAYNSRAFTYAHINEFSQAVIDIEKSLSMEPNEPNALHTYGFIYLQQKDWEHAIEYFNKALFIDPELKDAYEDRAKAYRALGETALAKADEAKVEELKKSP